MPRTIAQLNDLMRRADRIGEMIRERARKEAQAAGGLDYGTIHNALVSLHYGKPWREVNYSRARKARWLYERSHEPRRIVHGWYDRHYREILNSPR